jgi:hypothetical protein
VGKVHLSEIISSVDLYRVNIGGRLCCEWEKYTSVKLYLVLSYTVLIYEEGYVVRGKSTPN